MSFYAPRAGWELPERWEIELCNKRVAGRGEVSIGRVGDEHPDGVYIGRPSPLGNRFTVEAYGRDEAIDKYDSWAREQLDDHPDGPFAQAFWNLIRRVKSGRGVHLQCWCVGRGLACHGMALAGLIEEALE